MEVIIGAASSILGDIASKGVVRTDGAVTGTIEADWLIVSRTGVVKGDVSARGIVIDGTVEGNIKSKEMVEIKSQGIVKGDIRTSKLVILEGAFFEGHSFMEGHATADKAKTMSYMERVKKVVHRLNLSGGRSFS